MKYKVGVIPGDGIGPEVVQQGIKVLNAISKHTDLVFDFRYIKMGGISIDEFGVPLTDEAIEDCKNVDAILFGAIGDPKYDNNPNISIRPEQGLLKLRKELNLYANIRPVKAYENLYEQSPLKVERIRDVDIVIYRELTGGIYFGKKGTRDEGAIAFDTCEYEITEVYRILKLAFEAAQKRNKHLTLVDKANVMETSRLWRKLAKEMHKDYSDVELDFLFVDNAAMQLILNPRQFDVIVTSNMFGDILSDEASVIAGSLGLLASASVGEKIALFEPIHGSYPQAKGKNIANPIGTILSVAMLLDYLGYPSYGEQIRKGVVLSFEKGIEAIDLRSENFSTTDQIGDFIASYIEENVSQPMISAWGEI